LCITEEREKKQTEERQKTERNEPQQQEEKGRETKLKVLDGLHQAAVKNKETHYVAALYDILTSFVPEWKIPPGLGRIGCLSREQLQILSFDVKTDIFGLTYNVTFAEVHHIFYSNHKRVHC